MDAVVDTPDDHDETCPPFCHCQAAKRSPEAALRQAVANCEVQLATDHKTLSAEPLCRESFARLSDSKVVTCILPVGHWPKTAHAFSKDVSDRNTKA